MVTVIKHGKEVIETATCKSCDCVFTFHSRDTKKKWIYDKYIKSISCPECGKTVILEKIDLPHTEYTREE